MDRLLNNKTKSSVNNLFNILFYFFLSVLIISNILPILLSFRFTIYASSLLNAGNLLIISFLLLLLPFTSFFNLLLKNKKVSNYLTSLIPTLDEYSFFMVTLVGIFMILPNVIGIFFSITGTLLDLLLAVMFLSFPLLVYGLSFYYVFSKKKPGQLTIWLWFIVSAVQIGAISVTNIIIGTDITNLLNVLLGFWFIIRSSMLIRSLGGLNIEKHYNFTNTSKPKIFIGLLIVISALVINNQFFNLNWYSLAMIALSISDISIRLLSKIFKI